MPHQVYDIIIPIWNFMKRFTRDFWTLLKFRGREFDERLQVRFPTTIRALIWLVIVLGSLGLIIFALTSLSDFAFSKININGIRPSPTPDPAGQYEYK